MQLGFRPLEHNAIVIGRQLDKLNVFQAARFDGFDGRFRRYSQFSSWPVWFAQDRRFLARAPMPVDDGKAAGWLQDFAYRLRQSDRIGNAVKDIRHENKVGRPRCKRGKLAGVTRYKFAIRRAGFREPTARDFQQVAVDVDRDNAARDLGDLKREPAVARA